MGHPVSKFVEGRDSLMAALIEMGRRLAARGWLPATSGNLSARMEDGRIAITPSGRDKWALREEDLIIVDAAGWPLAGGKPSAETLLHTTLYHRYPEVGAVLHTHSPNATVISLRRSGGVHLEGYELLKALRGITTHECRVTLPVFDNDQDIGRLAERVGHYLDNHTPVYGYLIAGHGLYSWGNSLEEAVRHLEAIEFLIGCELQLRGATWR